MNLSNIPQGYKQTELGIIPEDWEVRQLGDCVNVYDGTHQTPNYVPVGIPFYSVENVTANNFSHTKYISPNEHRILTSRYKIQKGDVLMTRIGSIGVCKYVDWDADASFYVSLALLKPYNIDALYLSMASNATYFKNSILLNSLQFAIPQKINLGNISNVKILAPPIAEQRAIAEALSDVDGLIAALDKKIAKKRLVKQGAMQQLLTGKKRLPDFTDEWVEVRLDDYATMNSGGTPTSSNAEYYNGNIPFLSISDITNAGKYIKATEKTITEKGLQSSSARMFPAGTIMYAMYASLGKTSIAGIELSCSQAILGIKPNSSIDNHYLYYVLSFMEEDVKVMGQTGTQTNLSKQIVQNFLLNIPKDIKEQQAIATVLSDMDKEIADLEAQRDKYRLLKSGMMQKLLTGQVRLK